MEEFGAPSFDGSQPCMKVDPEIFFPHPTDRMGTKMAKDICNSCHFLNKCLDYALWEPSLDGIWGGTTPRQRETLRTMHRRRMSV